ncbi:hypothetical protein D3C85_910020 [compost metagenome]
MAIVVRKRRVDAIEPDARCEQVGGGPAEMRPNLQSSAASEPAGDRIKARSFLNGRVSRGVACVASVIAPDVRNALAQVGPFDSPCIAGRRLREEREEIGRRHARGSVIVPLDFHPGLLLDLHRTDASVVEGPEHGALKAVGVLIEVVVDGLPTSLPVTIVIDDQHTALDEARVKLLQFRLGAVVEVRIETEKGEPERARSLKGFSHVAGHEAHQAHVIAG